MADDDAVITRAQLDAVIREVRRLEQSPPKQPVNLESPQLPRIAEGRHAAMLRVVGDVLEAVASGDLTALRRPL